MLENVEDFFFLVSPHYYSCMFGQQFIKFCGSAFADFFCDWILDHDVPFPIVSSVVYC